MTDEMTTTQASRGAPNDVSPDKKASDHTLGEEREELMTALRHETGHITFGSYLGFDDEEDFSQQILAWLSPFFANVLPDGLAPPVLTPLCTVYDLKEGENSALTLHQRCCESSPIRVVQSLRAPPANVCTQILLCPHLLSRDLIETFGLALGLTRDYLKAIFEAHPARSENMPRSLAYNREFYAKAYYQFQDFVTMGEAVATIIRGRRVNAQIDVPTVVIVGAMDSYQHINNVLATSNGPSSLNDEASHWARWYRNDLEKFLGLSKNPTDYIAIAPNIALIPLISMTAGNVRRECWRIRNSRGELMETFKDEKGLLDRYTFSMSTDRLRLRSYIEAIEDAWMRFNQYMMVHGADVRQNPSMAFLGKAFEDEINAARRLESELRDYLQLEVGELALQESKKSIEISNFQIQEGRRGQHEGSKKLRLRSC